MDQRLNDFWERIDGTSFCEIVCVESLSCSFGYKLKLVCCEVVDVDLCYARDTDALSRDAHILFTGGPSDRVW